MPPRFQGRDESGCRYRRTAWIGRYPRGIELDVASFRVSILLPAAILGASCSSGSSHSATSDAGADGPSAPMGARDAGVVEDSGGASDGMATPDTWENYAKNFFATYCTSCHNPMDPTGRDYNIQVDVLSDKSAMRCGVASSQDPAWNCGPSPVAKQFPIGNGPKPSNAERARIVAWINAGEP